MGAAGTSPVGVILAGGRGRRLGGDKALVDLAGRPLITYALAALEAVVADVVVVAKADTALPDLGPRIGVWVEPDEPRHPLAGIAYALRRAGGRSVLVCAADMPLVTPGLLETIVAAGSDVTCGVVPRAGGRLQPVCALYGPGALTELERFPAGARATDVVAGLDVVTLDVGDADAFLSVNTHADLELALSLLTRGISRT
jgi:molybdopterin-guanine dinucleotide biosynthesis protein A